MKISMVYRLLSALITWAWSIYLFTGIDAALAQRRDWHWGVAFFILATLQLIRIVRERRCRLTHFCDLLMFFSWFSFMIFEWFNGYIYTSYPPIANIFSILMYIAVVLSLLPIARELRHDWRLKCK